MGGLNTLKTALVGPDTPSEISQAWGETVFPAFPARARPGPGSGPAGRPLGLYLAELLDDGTGGWAYNRRLSQLGDPVGRKCLPDPRPGAPKGTRTYLLPAFRQYRDRGDPAGVSASWARSCDTAASSASRTCPNKKEGSKQSPQKLNRTPQAGNPLTPHIARPAP